MILQQQFVTSMRMHFNMLKRRTIVLLLLCIIPALFILVVYLTASPNDIAFQLASADTKTIVRTSQINLALVFVSLATIGFLAAFLSLNLVQQYQAANRRLVICGFDPSALILSSLLILLTIIFLLATCIGLVDLYLFKPVDASYMMVGFLLIGLTYGSYGILVGSLVKGELEGTLLVILLANIDAGWLQNPLFFSGARNKLLIQMLPAYHSSQISITASFTQLSVQKQIISSLPYTIAFLILAIVVSYYKMNIKNRMKLS